MNFVGRAHAPRGITQGIPPHLLVYPVENHVHVSQFQILQNKAHLNCQDNHIAITIEQLNNCLTPAENVVTRLQEV